jgi:cytochrome c biogenesis protein CcdA
MVDVTLPLILGTGLLDGINPCAFAVMIFLLTYLLHVSNNRSLMLKTGIIYITVVYITYLLAGLGILSFISALGSGPSRIVFYIAAVTSIIFGLINLKDFFSTQKDTLLKIPDSAKPLLEKYIHKANIPAAIILGILVSMVELPCTGAVYFSVLALLAKSTTALTGFLYLLIYNLMFVIPLIIILFLVNFGMKAENIENWREKERGWMKLMMALLLITLGILMLTGII